MMIIVLPFPYFSQVGIGTSDPKSVLDVQSTSSGVLIPRMTTVQREAIKPGVSENGLLVYDTDLQIFMVYKKNREKWAYVDTDSAGLLNLTPLSSTEPYTLTTTYQNMGEVEIDPIAEHGEMLAQCNIQNNLSHNGSIETVSSKFRYVIDGVNDVEVLNGSVNDSDSNDYRVVVKTAIIPIHNTSNTIRIRLEGKKTKNVGTVTIPFFDCLIMEKIPNILN